LLQSVLHLGDQLLWCEVITRGRHKYDVHIVPQWNTAIAVVEPYDRVATAVRRHAEVSWLLRESGWEPVAAQGHVPPRATAA
jgi:hypothetical protein